MLFRKLIMFSALLSLGACTSAVFPDVIEDDQARIEGKIVAENSSASVKTKKIVREMPKEGAVLTGDIQNVAYEDDEEVKMDTVLTEASVNEQKDEVLAAKTVPVVKKDINTEEQKVEVAENSVKDEKVEQVQPVIEEDAQPSVSYRAETIYFANGSAVVDASYNAALRRIVKEAKANDAVVRVLGFASSRTRNTDVISHKLANFKVSMERAQNVANALRRAGLSVDKIEIEALSDSAPVYLEVMPEGERLNRRAEIYITY